MHTEISVTIEVFGLHQWTEASPHRSYLQPLHRHKFIITGTAPVSHADRDIEFHDLKDKLASALPGEWKAPNLINFGGMSCEHIGLHILKEIPVLTKVTVSEDGECAGTVSRRQPTTERHEALRIVTLCGSTKFRMQYETASFLLEKLGIAVMSVGSFMHASRIPLDAEKEALDRLHKQKIEASDAIVVINPNEYIGESTASEIQHAHDLGKEVYFVHGNRAYINGWELVAKNITEIHPDAAKESDYWLGRRKLPFILRDALHEFALDMEAKLIIKDGKGGWAMRHIYPDLYQRVMDEAHELYEAIAAGSREENPDACDEEIKGEAVDVANFAMMIHDNVAKGRKYPDPSDDEIPF